MTYKVFRHPEVDQDIYDIVDLIARYAGVKVAERKLSEIEATVKALARTPHIGSIRDDIAPGLRAIPTAKKGVVAFTVDDAEESVFIISMTYAGADWIAATPYRVTPEKS